MSRFEKYLEANPVFQNAYITALVLGGLFWLWILLMTGFIVLIPVIALVIWIVRALQKNDLKAKLKWGAALIVLSLVFSALALRKLQDAIEPEKPARPVKMESKKAPQRK